MQKRSFIIIAVILLLSLSSMLSPAAFAADPKVIDGYGDNQTENLTDTEESDETPAAEETEEKSFIVIIGQLILYTGFILFLIYALIKFLAMRQKSLQPNQAVQMMGGTSLGNNKSLQLVKVGEQIYLIGVGDQVTLIKEFSAEDEINGIEKNLETQTALVPKSVSSFIKEKIGGRMNNETDGKSGGFENLFKQSLEKQKQKQERLQLDLTKQEDEKDGRSS